ncbi:glycosidase [Virgibacillus halotolerans]|uniref:alpha-amylase family glycosyl hydrolase n=1 Tax=Virgibacillus halotolerans TaxID=1071053 RepID=UPI0019622404|nr:alpha-amylase family glycosyl hydrolase [Virgibacillus halotolerans]MBM7601654.1 glycosidase [Virgibacillus halotolerans]
MKRTAIMLLTALFIFTNVSYTEAAGLEDRQLNEEVIYNILVDRFNNGNFQTDDQVDLDDPRSFHGGDIQGIIAKLDQLDELGITTISLSPIMENAPGGYHGNWIENFTRMDEQFGSIEDLEALIDGAHKRGIKVVLEFVTNYVAKSHPIVDDPDKQDWVKEQTETDPEWLDNVVKLDQDNLEVAAFLHDAANFWMDETDIDGFKLQAVDQSSLDFLANFTKDIKERDPDFYLLGDILVTDENREQILEKTEIQAIDNVALYESMTDVFSKVDTPVIDLLETEKNNGGDADLLYVDNQYTKRFSQQFAEQGRNDVTTWKLALTYMYTMPGTPGIFQGSEIPMYGENAEEAQMLVQFNSGNTDIKEFHDRIASLRTEFPVLSYGDFEIVDSSKAMSVYKRTYKDETMYIAINNGSESESVTVTGMDSGMQLHGFLGDNIVRETENGEYKIGLPRETAEVFTVEEDSGLNWGFIGFILGVFALFIAMIVFLSRKQKKRNAEADAEQKK